MASRLKEDERMRGFSSFLATGDASIATACREYTHRVKSVSMAKFTSQEVAALQGGGNESATVQGRSMLRSGTHSVTLYLIAKDILVRGVCLQEQRWVKKRVHMRAGGQIHLRGGSRGPAYGDDKIFRNNYDERRSPGYDQESRYANNYKKSPIRFEVVDDRQRDRFGNERKFEYRRYPNGESKSEGRSPNRQMDTSSPPMVHPVRDILGEDVPPLRVGEPPKASIAKPADGLTQTQRTTSSSSSGSKDGGSLEPKQKIH